MAKSKPIRSKSALQKQRADLFVKSLKGNQVDSEIFKKFKDEYVNEMQRNDDALDYKLKKKGKEADGHREYSRQDHKEYLKSKDDYYRRSANEQAERAEKAEVQKSYMQYKKGGDGTTRQDAYDRDKRAYENRKPKPAPKPKPKRTPKPKPAPTSKVKGVLKTVKNVAKKLTPLSSLITAVDFVVNPMEVQAPTYTDVKKQKNPQTKKPLYIEPSSTDKSNKMYDSYKKSKKNLT